MNHSSSESIAVIGAGTMGIGIAQVAASAGHPVLLYDNNNEAAHQAVQKLSQQLHQRVAKGKMAIADVNALLQQIVIVHTLSDLAPAVLVIEAIAEKLEVKQALFLQLESCCPPQTLFASNTSTLSITAIANVLQQPERLAGMHFFNPPPLMKLVEVIAGKQSSELTLHTLVELARRWGKQPVSCHSTPGFIVNRIARSFYGETLRALEEQLATPATLDAVLRDGGGFPMGPLQLMDLIGHDISAAACNSVYQAMYADPRYRPSRLQRELVDAGQLGRKSGAGFYHYDGSALPQPELAATEQNTPTHISVHGNWSGLPGFSALLQKNGVNVSEGHDEAGVSPYLRLDDVVFMLTTGKLSSQLAEEMRVPVVQFDLSADHQQASLITLSAASQNTAQQTAMVVAFVQSLGKQVILLPDYPGLLVLRTLAMLCNEALEVVHQGIASAADTDTAMCYGVNYPRGPLAWGEQLGWSTLLSTLEQLQQFYGDTRYRPSPLLRQLAAGWLTLKQQTKRENHHV